MTGNSNIIVKLDPTPYSSKPHRDEFAAITRRLQSADPVEVTCDELADAIKRGCTFMAGVYAPSSGAWGEFIGQRLFALDFDHPDELDLQGALDRCVESGIWPMLAYPTFTATADNPKFRLVFDAGELVTDEGEARDHILTLLRLFPEADQACKNPNRIWLGGREVNDYRAGASDYAPLLARLAELQKDAKPQQPRKGNHTKAGAVPQGERPDELTEDQKSIKSALDEIPPAKLTYDEWLAVGMALQAEGFCVDTWDKWSSLDKARYHEGECAAKWGTFSADGFRRKYVIYQLARRFGWRGGEYRGARGKMLHNVVAKTLIDEKCACLIDGITPAIWSDGHYATGWDGIEREIRRLVDSATTHECQEVQSYLRIKAPHVKRARPEFIAFTNGILNVKTGDMLQPDPSIVIQNVIPHDYDPDAYDETADRFLDSVSDGDAATRAALEECIGLCMFPSNEFGICVVLIGDGANGKSVYLLALLNAIGRENCSTLHINALGGRFARCSLVGRLANIGDDISKVRLDGDTLAMFKSIVTGSTVYTDVKYGRGFDFTPYCTFVFSCNQFPRLEDHSNGTLRRLFPVEFSATFKPDNPEFDPQMDRKMQTESAARYLLARGVEGLCRVIERGTMTPNERGARLLAGIEVENDSVLSFIEDMGLARHYFADKLTSAAFSEYKDWCHESGRIAVGKGTFSKKVCKVFGLATETTKVSGRPVRKYVSTDGHATKRQV